MSRSLLLWLAISLAVLAVCVALPGRDRPPPEGPPAIPYHRVAP